jgi:hypothetical protein
MSNILEPQITETKSTKFSEYIKNNPNILQNIIGNTSSTPVLCKDGTTKNELSSPNARYADACINNGGRADLTAQQKAQLQLAQQKALMEQMTTYSGLTDKVFGKQSNFVSGGGNRFLILPTYMILGAVVGRYIAKNIKKSTTLGMVVGGLAPLLAYQLSIEYDRKNMPKQEPRQKVAVISEQEKISLFNDAILTYQGGVAPRQSLLDSIKLKKETANAKIKEFKLENEFSIWLNARPKVDYGMYPPA